MHDGKGFVTCLFEQLYYEFEQLGAPWPAIWRDSRSIDPADQFDPIIEEAIEQSDVFLAVLSPNWMESDYCKQELNGFMRRWQHEGELRVKQRIVVACKRFVERGKRPSLMQGQQGYDFFAFEGPKETGLQFDFFARGEIRDKRYDKIVGGLAGLLYRRAQQVTRTIPAASEVALEPPRAPISDPPTHPLPGAGARKVYLAKPAADMREAYSRLVEELSRNGYAVVPDPRQDIPHDTSATTFIDEALGEADVSIHLIGVREGYTPETIPLTEKSEPIVKLQLARAKQTIDAAAGQSNGSRAGFRRIIWAPELMEAGADQADSDAKSSADVSEQSRTAKKRQPQDILAKFGNYLPTDKVLGGTLSKFVDFLIEHLRQSDSHVNGSAEITADDWIYVYHVPADTKYACDLMDALQQGGARAKLPALEGDPADVRRVHQQRLSECSAVVLCWAQATEAWAHARADELKDWKKLGRQKKFIYRGLLAGPPPGERKTVFVRYAPANDIDIVVNLNEESEPLAKAVDKFIHLARPHVQ
jgi:hypothetical protein